MSNYLHFCLEWLDQQAENSVVYVSFGTTTAFTDEQIRELALGLEQSGQKFIWVLRDADKGDVFDGEGVRRPELPQGYEERVKERWESKKKRESLGMVRERWESKRKIECLGIVSARRESKSEREVRE